jgi:TolB-like protein/DNA-binding winged helix-turn-helix (wHTH) protein/Tfp pilus assembly protein PilF
LIYRFDRFQVDDENFRLTADGVEIPLEPKALRLLLYLIGNRNRLIRKQEILDGVWQQASISESALTRSIGLLRKALDDDSREPRFIQTVPTAGYRFIADVIALPKAEPRAAPLEPPPSFDPPPPPVPPPPVPSPSAWRSRGGLVAAGAVGLLLLVALGIWLHRRHTASAPIRSLAVLPLDNLSGDPTQEYFADSMTDELITELASIPGLRVVSRTSIMQEKGSHKALQQIATELNADAVVEGSIVRSGDKVRITAQLIDARTDRHLWARSFEGTSTDIVALQDSVAREIAAQAKLVLVPEAEVQSRSINPAAHDAYLRGRYFFGKGDVSHSAQYFQQAIAIDPSYASAYAGLANALDAATTVGLGRPDEVMPRATAAARHALDLDPNNGEAHTALGSIETIYDWNWKQAEYNLTRGISLSPSDSLAEMKYAVYLDAIGQADQAVIHMRRALALDPLSFFINRRLGATLYLARDYDGAIQQLQRAAEMEPSRKGVVDNWMSYAYEAKGGKDDAVEHDLLALKNDWPQVDTSALRSTYARKGWDAYWRARLQAPQPFDQDQCAAFGTARSYARLGDKENAFSSLNRAVDRRCYEIVWLQTDPRFDSLRSDARYKNLLQRLNLAAQ